MPKQSKIKWRDKDIRELQRVVRNFNQKISRVAKKDPTKAEFLPRKISVKALQGRIGTRKDFKRELSSLQRFSKRGAEKIEVTESGLTLTKYEIKEVKNKVRITNIKRAIERKKLTIDEKKGTMGQVSSQNLRSKTFSLNKSQKEWEKFVESLEKEIASRFKVENLENYKQNYLDAIEKFLGGAGEKLYNLVKEVDIEKLFINSVEVPTLSISFTSDPLEAEYIAERAYQDWLDVL